MLFYFQHLEEEIVSEEKEVISRFEHVRSRSKLQFTSELPLNLDVSPSLLCSSCSDFHCFSHGREKKLLGNHPPPPTLTLTTNYSANALSFLHKTRTLLHTHTHTHITNYHQVREREREGERERE